MKYHLQLKKTENVGEVVWDLRGKQFIWKQEKRIFGKGMLLGQAETWGRGVSGFSLATSEPVFLVVISDAGRFLGTTPSS